MENEQLYDYHIRITEIIALNTWLDLNVWEHVHPFEPITSIRFIMVVEERNTPKQHIHILATMSASSAKQIRVYLKQHFQENPTPHKRPYSVARRRGNLLAYLLKDLKQGEIDQIFNYTDEEEADDASPVYSIDTPTSFLHSSGFTKQELMTAYKKSYPKIKTTKETFSHKRQLWITNWLSPNEPNPMLSEKDIAKLFISDLLQFYIACEKAPPSTRYVSFLLLKHNFIKPSAYAKRTYHTILYD